MPDFITQSKARIRQAIDLLTANRNPITVKIEGENTSFDSRIVKVDHAHPDLEAGTAGRVFIQWLSPARGNDLIQSVNPIQVRSSLGRYRLGFGSYYVTESLEFPHRGHIITYPESLVIEDRRRSDRYEVGSNATPLFGRARIGIGTGGTKERVYDFGVFDVSENGVGLLVGEGLSGWLERIGIGDRLKEVELYTRWSIVRMDGTVRHKSKVREGKYSGYRLLGIELDEKLELYG
jgi:hypothetical protein